MSSGAGGLWLVFSDLLVVTTVEEKTMPSANKSSIVRITQTCEIAVSLHKTLWEKKKKTDRDTDSDLYSVILVKSHTTVYKHVGTSKCVGTSLQAATRSTKGKVLLQEALVTFFRLLSRKS